MGDGVLNFPFPVCVLVANEALQAMTAYTISAYKERPTEWGGLMWGKVFRHPVTGLVPVVVCATDGICDATNTRCDILPETWDAGRIELTARGYGDLDLVPVGDYHSHPKMGVFFSAQDALSFASYGDIPYWCSMVLDPFHNEYGVFGRRDPRSWCRIQHFIPSRRVLGLLGMLPEGQDC